MAITIEQFKHIVQLAYLDPEDVADQLDRCSATIKAVEQLQIVDTTRISPLHHPTSITQYLRPDSDVILPDVNDLAKNAPTFIDNFYTVPLIIKGP